MSIEYIQNLLVLMKIIYTQIHTHIHTNTYRHVSLHVVRKYFLCINNDYESNPLYSLTTALLIIAFYYISNHKNISKNK